jgi:uncharacterized coiled-coil protein SlyX
LLIYPVRIFILDPQNLIAGLSNGSFGTIVGLGAVSIIGYAVINWAKSELAKIPEYMSKAKKIESEDSIIAKIKADHLSAYDMRLEENNETHKTLFEKFDEVKAELSLLDKAYSEGYIKLETRWEQQEKTLTNLSTQLEKVESRVESRIDRLELQLNQKLDMFNQNLTQALNSLPRARGRRPATTSK